MSFSHWFRQLILLGISVPLFLSPLRLQGNETQGTRSREIAFFHLLECNFSFKLSYILSDLLDNVGIPASALVVFHDEMRTRKERKESQRGCISFTFKTLDLFLFLFTTFLESKIPQLFCGQEENKGKSQCPEYERREVVFPWRNDVLFWVSKLQCSTAGEWLWPRGRMRPVWTTQRLGQGCFLQKLNEGQVLGQLTAFSFVRPASWFSFPLIHMWSV